MKNKNIKNLPKHIGFIMGGNATWARKNGLTTQEGHVEGTRNLLGIVDWCLELGVNEITTYAFSTENWQRPKDEIDNLMYLVRKTLNEEKDNFNKKGVRVKIIGSLEKFDKDVVSSIKEVEEITKNNTKLFLDIAFGYGGRQEIVDTTKKIAQQVLDRKIGIGDIDEKLFSKNLYDPKVSYPDLVIRTSGGSRISNFLLWQIAYSEFYFTKTCWPEFGKEELIKAIDDFSNRKRTFGKR